MDSGSAGIETQWPMIKALFWRALLSSVHYAIASVDANGEPHVTPIGTVILTEPGRGIFFERFTTQLPKNLKTNDKVCILAVDSGRLFWLRSLVTGTFATPPGIRLFGTVGALRDATPEEIERWQRRVRIARWTKGYKRIWADMTRVREIRFTRVEPLRIGPMMPKPTG